MTIGYLESYALSTVPSVVEWIRLDQVSRSSFQFICYYNKNALSGGESRLLGDKFGLGQNTDPWSTDPTPPPPLLNYPLLNPLEIKNYVRVN